MFAFPPLALADRIALPPMVTVPKVQGIDRDIAAVAGAAGGGAARNAGNIASANAIGDQGRIARDVHRSRVDALAVADRDIDLAAIAAAAIETGVENIAAGAAGVGSQIAIDGDRSAVGGIDGDDPALTVAGVVVEVAVIVLALGAGVQGHAAGGDRPARGGEDIDVAGGAVFAVEVGTWREIDRRGVNIDRPRGDRLALRNQRGIAVEGPQRQRAVGVDIPGLREHRRQVHRVDIGVGQQGRVIDNDVRNPCRRW